MQEEGGHADMHGSSQWTLYLCSHLTDPEVLCSKCKHLEIMQKFVIFFFFLPIISPPMSL